MSSTAIYATQLSVGKYPCPRNSAHVSLSASSTLVNVTDHTDRPSIRLEIPGGASDILNSAVADPTGKSLFSISSTSKRTVLVSCRDNVKIATVEWDRPSPRIIFRRRKVKCKEWLPRVAPETESRILTQGDSQFTWVDQPTTGYLIPVNRHGLSIAQWHIDSNSDDLHLEIFQEALVESGLLVAIVLSLVLIRSGRSLGDSLEELSIGNRDGGLGCLAFTQIEPLNVPRPSPQAAELHRDRDIGGPQGRFSFFKRATPRLVV